MLKGLIMQASHTELLEYHLTACGLPWRKLAPGSGAAMLQKAVNNAGVSESTPFTEYTEATFDKVMDMNAK